jgi:hypothetical protein
LRGANPRDLRSPWTEQLSATVIERGRDHGQSVSPCDYCVGIARSSFSLTRRAGAAPTAPLEYLEAALAFASNHSLSMAIAQLDLTDRPPCRVDLPKNYRRSAHRASRRSARRWVATPPCIVSQFRSASGALPVPDSGIICGDPAALSLTINSAICGVVSIGLKVTGTLQLLPAFNVLMHVVLTANGASVPTENCESREKSTALVLGRSVAGMLKLERSSGISVVGRFRSRAVV